MIKTLSKSIGEYKKPAMLTPMLVMLEVVLESSIPFVMAMMIDNVQSKNMKMVIIQGCILLSLAIISLFIGVLAGRTSALASTGFAKNLRKNVFSKVQGFAFSNIDRFSTSSLVTRLTTDITNVQNAYMMIIRVAIRSPLMLSFSVIMSFGINAKIASYFLILIPVIAIIITIILRITKPMFDRIFKKYDNMNNGIQENIKGMRLVKAYVREDYENEKFDLTAEEIRREFTLAEKIMALSTPLIQFLLYGIVLITSISGTFLIINTFGGIGADGVYNWGELSTGELSGLISYATQILMSMLMFAMIFVMITLAGASAKRITEVLKEEEDITNPENPIFDVKTGSISFENVNFKYSKTAKEFALKDINFEIESGQTIGIIGGTGSSKTTLVQLMSRIYDTTSGIVKVGGVDVSDYDVKSLRDNVAVVLQKNVLFSGTIKENLRWGDKNATDEELINACKQAQAHDFITSFENGYDTYIEQGGTNVSGGQKQRLCIARALLKKPKILILDDSTSAVDTKTDALIRDAFYNDIPDTTKIIVSQRISSISSADKIFVLSGGTIDSCGTHEELLSTCEIYKEVYYSQNKEVIDEKNA